MSTAVRDLHGLADMSALHALQKLTSEGLQGSVQPAQHSPHCRHCNHPLQACPQRHQWLLNLLHCLFHDGAQQHLQTAQAAQL